MGTVATECAQYLSVLLGMPLAMTRRAADMRGFHFGTIREVPKGTVGEIILHVQCPWRIEGPGGIITGRHDLYEPVHAVEDWDAWDYDVDGNLQDQQLARLLQGYDEHTRTVLNVSGQLVVERVAADDYGGFGLDLSGGYRLVVFPAGSRGEAWRLFRSGHAAHVVLEAGRLEVHGAHDQQ